MSNRTRRWQSFTRRGASSAPAPTSWNPGCAPASRHALQGDLVARVLSLIFPGDREALTDAGTLIGREREIAGLHYPSDAKASRILGQSLFARLLANGAFLAEVEAARSEWRRGEASSTAGPPAAR